MASVDLREYVHIGAYSAEVHVVEVRIEFTRSDKGVEAVPSFLLATTQADGSLAPADNLLALPASPRVLQAVQTLLEEVRAATKASPVTRTEPIKRGLPTSRLALRDEKR